MFLEVYEQIKIFYVTERTWRSSLIDFYILVMSVTYFLTKIEL